MNIMKRYSNKNTWMKSGRKSTKRGVKLVIILFLWVLFTILPLFTDEPIDKNPTEYKYKAILIWNIARLVEWPKNSGIEDPSKPLILGVIDEDPFEGYLKIYFSQKRLKGKRVEIRYLKEIEEIEECQILFISSEINKKKLAGIIEYTSDKPILTFGDAEGYSRKGILVNFYLDEADTDQVELSTSTANIGIEINDTAAHQAGLLFPKTLYESARKNFPYDPSRDKVIQMERITRFIEWPKKSTLNTSQKTFIITVIGDNSFASSIERTLRNQKIKNKSPQVRSISSANQIGDTNILYISGNQRNELPIILNSIKKKPILTISETEGFSQMGVHVNFSFVEYRLIFDINSITAKDAGLEINWQLLKAARNVILPPQK